MVAGQRQRRRGSPGRADLRRRGGPHRRGIGCRTTAFQLSGRAAAGAATPLDRLHAVGQRCQQLEDNALAASLDSYQAILDADPNHAEAKGAVRQIVFLMRATAQSPDAVAVADAAPDDIEAAFAAAAVQIL